MFRLAYSVAFIVLLWLRSLFTQTVHVIHGDVHVFKYNWVPWLFLVMMALITIGFAGVAHKLLKDRTLAMLCLLTIPLWGLIAPKLLYERVEVSDRRLVHRREPPHTRFNVDIRWDAVIAVTKIEREQAGLFAPNFYNVGYEFAMRTGQLHELPSNTVLTRAHGEIDRILAARGIPVNNRVIPIPRQ